MQDNLPSCTSANLKCSRTPRCGWAVLCHSKPLTWSTSSHMNYFLYCALLLPNVCVKGRRVFGLTQGSEDGRTWAVKIFKRRWISKFREHKQGPSSKRKKNQVSLFLKCAEILSNLASSKHRISWTPQLEPGGPKPLLKCSLPRKRGIKALQSSGVPGQPTMCSIFTCKKIHMPTTKPFQMCVEKLSQYLLAPFLPLPVF